MIFCNLKTLLAQRNITISKISSDTKLSRTTITSLCSNKSGGIQFDTLDTICSYLKVLPSEVILFSPYQINFSLNGEDVKCTVMNKVNGKTFSLSLIIEPDQYGLYLNHYEDENQKFEELNKIIKDLPQYYITHLDETLKNILSRKTDSKISPLFSIVSNIY